MYACVLTAATATAAAATLPCVLPAAAAALPYVLPAVKVAAPLIMKAAPTLTVAYSSYCAYCTYCACRAWCRAFGSIVKKQ